MNSIATDPWRRPRWAWLFLAQLALVVAAMVLASSGRLPTTLFRPPVDKLGHLAAYGGLAFLAVAFFGPARRWRVAAVLLAAAALEELSQRAFPARTFDLGDLAMNACGIVGFVALPSVYAARRRAVRLEVPSAHRGPARLQVSPHHRHRGGGHLGH